MTSSRVLPPAAEVETISNGARRNQHKEIDHLDKHRESDHPPGGDEIDRVQINVDVRDLIDGNVHGLDGIARHPEDGSVRPRNGNREHHLRLRKSLEGPLPRKGKRKDRRQHLRLSDSRYRNRDRRRKRSRSRFERSPNKFSVVAGQCYLSATSSI